MTLRYGLWATALALVVGCGDDGAILLPNPSCGQGRVCNCAPGDDRPDCNPCQQGFRPALIGSDCVPTCSAPDIDCGESGVCEETASGAVCRCDPGHAGAGCESCEVGLTRNDAGRCVAELSGPALLTLSDVGSERVLGALVPPGWSFRPLTSVPSTVTDIAVEPGSGRVFALNAGRLSILDLASGAVEELTSADADLGSALSLDPAGGRALSASADAIYGIDLETFQIEELSAAGARGLEYDPNRARILGLDEAGATFELVDSLPELVGQTQGSDWLAMAFDPEIARAYLLGSEAESREDRLLRYCAGVLTRFGAVPAWHANVVVDAGDGSAAPLLLEYEGADPALIVADLGTQPVDAVTIAVDHPDAAVCVIDDSSRAAALEIELSASLRAGFLLVAAPGRAVSVDAAQRPADASYSVIVHTDAGLSVSGPSQGITEHDTPAWEALALDSFSSFAERRGATLTLMDWASQATLQVRLAHEPAGNALAWVGEAP
ncbi:calcium-binding EGF-like domain-containing protein [Sorangium sp. So ce375]|uniref:calcium-binding EGF-like domain-containing protein n=1 Tax=Sorangium sp. So ce375 TaxID=3133306 RepID=UPI003F5BE915